MGIVFKSDTLIFLWPAYSGISSVLVLNPCVLPSQSTYSNLSR